MGASAWIALGSLAFFVLGQAVTIAFLLGGLFNRVKVVEGKPSDAADCKAELAVLTTALAVLSTKFEGMKGTLESVASDLKNLASSKPAPGRRATAP